MFQILLLTPRDHDTCNLGGLDHHALHAPADVTQGLEDKTQICRIVGIGRFTIEIQREFGAAVDVSCIESLVKQFEEALALNLSKRLADRLAEKALCGSASESACHQWICKRNAVFCLCRDEDGRRRLLQKLYQGNGRRLLRIGAFRHGMGWNLSWRHCQNQSTR